MRLGNTGATYNLNLQYRMNRWVKLVSFFMRLVLELHITSITVQRTGGLNIGEFLYDTGATYNLNLQYRMNRWVKLNIGEFLYEIREYWSYI